MHTRAVETNEILFRQIGPKGTPFYFDPDRAQPVEWNLFIPSTADDDGLSMIRSRSRTEVWAAYRAERPDVRFRLARLRADHMIQLAAELGFPSFGFETTPDQLDHDHGEPWAHCVASAINIRDYNSEAKTRIKEWARRVSKAVALEDVLGPFEKPNSNDPYRPEAQGTM